jgi:hypothetical protein
VQQITADEAVNATALVAEFEEWFNATVAAQEALPGSDEPVLTRDSVGIKSRPVGDDLRRLHRRPRPTPVPTPKVAKKNATNATGEEEEEEEGGAKSEDGAEEEQGEASAAGGEAGGPSDEKEGAGEQEL